MLDAWCLMLGAWRLVLDIWCLMLDAWTSWLPHPQREGAAAASTKWRLPYAVPSLWKPLWVGPAGAQVSSIKYQVSSTQDHPASSIQHPEIGFGILARNEETWLARLLVSHERISSRPRAVFAALGEWLSLKHKVKSMTPFKKVPTLKLLQ